MYCIDFYLYLFFTGVLPVFWISHFFALCFKVKLLDNVQA